MQPDLPDRVAQAFGVERPRFLAGRVRKHWHVRRGGEDLVLTRYEEAEASVRHEVRILKAVAGRGWPVPQSVDGPAFLEGRWWTLAPWLSGEPVAGADEPSRRGRLLAEFHASLADLPPLGIRTGFRRAERVRDDPAVEAALKKAERSLPEETAFVRWHLDRARLRLEGIDLTARPSRLIHGDFTTWNLLFQDGRLSAILDFE